jgi:hypothetical protein
VAHIWELILAKLTQGAEIGRESHPDALRDDDDSGARWDEPQEAAVSHGQAAKADVWIFYEVIQVIHVLHEVECGKGIAQGIGDVLLLEQLRALFLGVQRLHLYRIGVETGGVLVAVVGAVDGLGVAYHGLGRVADGPRLGQAGGVPRDAIAGLVGLCQLAVNGAIGLCVVSEERRRRNRLVGHAALPLGQFERFTVLSASTRNVTCCLAPAEAAIPRYPSIWRRSQPHE